jgi:hypothetical protein
VHYPFQPIVGTCSSSPDKPEPWTRRISWFGLTLPPLARSRAYVPPHVVLRRWPAALPLVRRQVRHVMALVGCDSHPRDRASACHRDIRISFPCEPAWATLTSSLYSGATREQCGGTHSCCTLSISRLTESRHVGIVRRLVSRPRGQSHEAFHDRTALGGRHPDSPPRAGGGQSG